MADINYESAEIKIPLFGKMKNESFGKIENFSSKSEEELQSFVDRKESKKLLDRIIKMPLFDPIIKIKGPHPPPPLSPDNRDNDDYDLNNR